jgi:hypothetical protein
VDVVGVHCSSFPLGVPSSTSWGQRKGGPLAGR